MDKENFLSELRKALIDKYGQPENAGSVRGWACDTEKLHAFVERTRLTITTDRNEVNLDGPAFRSAWKAIGGVGKITYKALRALPANETAAAS